MAAWRAVLVSPARDGRLEPTRAALRDLEVDELPFPSDSAVRLARLHASSGLRMADCRVLLAAEGAAASVPSFVDRLVQIPEARNLPVFGH